MKDWSIVGRLSTINVPTLLISGRFDEATVACVQPYADEIPDVRWTIFEQSSHMPHVEEREACMTEVAGFLDAQCRLTTPPRHGAAHAHSKFTHNKNRGTAR